MIPNRISQPTVVVVTLLTWAACSSDDPAVAPTSGRCDSEPHRWLPRAEVGKPLQRKESLLSPLGAEQLSAIAEAAGQVVPPALRQARYGAQLFSLRYTTQDRGQQVEATGMVAFPWHAEGLDEAFPVALLLHGTTGLTGACAPSTLGLEHAAPLYLLASQGFIVVAPDYIGLDAGGSLDAPEVRHAYLEIEQAGIGSLDMLRATFDMLAESEDVAVRPAREIVLWGGSQGGHAAFAVDLIAPLYAPELHISASVAMVPPTDLVALGHYALGGVNPATAVVAVAMLSHHLWFGRQEPFTELLTDREPTYFASTLPDQIYAACDSDDILDQIPSPDEIYAASFLADVDRGGLAPVEPWGCYASENSFSTTSIRRQAVTPTLFILGERDTLVDTASERADFDQLCSEGYQLEYLECAEASHTEAAGWSIVEQLSWVRDRLAGQPIDRAKLCQRTAPVRCSGQP